jgi:hypothetical protein
MDPNPAMTFKTSTKNYFFCLLIFEGTFTSFFKDKKSYRSHRTVGIVVYFFLLFLLDDKKDPGSGSLTNGSGFGSP